LTINRPERRNSMSVETMAALVTAFERADRDPDCRVVVVTGAGDDAFCAGADISDFQGQDRSTAELRDQYGAFLRLSEAALALGKPTIAAVNGVALGGGCALSLLLDLTIASDNAQFGLPEIKLGLFPMIVLPMLIRTVGRKKAFEIVYFGAMVDAAEAERIELVNAVVPAVELWPTVGKWVERLSRLSGETLRMGRQALLAMDGMSYVQALEYGRSIGSVVMTSPDAQEGVAAFLERRRPVWPSESALDREE
jgi:methylglutaconyl-CoA hydratase